MTRRSLPEVLEEVKARWRLADLVSASGVALRGRGRVLQGRCPFHLDREPSFTVYQDTERFYCFGCGVSGDLVDFLRLREGLSFAEVLERLAGPWDPPERPPRRREQGAPVRDVALLTAAARFYARTSGAAGQGSPTCGGGASDRRRRTGSSWATPRAGA